MAWICFIVLFNNPFELDYERHDFFRFHRPGVIVYWRCMFMFMLVIFTWFCLAQSSSVS